MADVTVAPQQIDVDGHTPTYTGSLSTSDTYKVQNDGETFLHFKKTGAGACNVTINTPGTVGGLAVAERVVSVPATTGDVMIGPFPPGVYNDSSGNLNVTLSEITGLTMAALRL